LSAVARIKNPTGFATARTIALGNQGG
jgi:hypothetical protein